MFKFTAELLGFEDYIPPYAAARGEDILRGVNYASAAAGIREETGQQLVILWKYINIVVSSFPLIFFGFCALIFSYLHISEFLFT